jgi:uncharacterized protein (TIGR00288 family)
MNEHYTHAPHRRPGAEEQYSNAALLIDFDNVTMGTRSNLGQELRKLLNSDIIKGKVAVQRAYADWRRYPQYIVSLSESSIDLIFAPAYGSSKKNATDIRLAIDALELVFTRPEIGTYILLSGDSDFSSLVLKLKEYGKYVIGVGMQESSSDLLVQNCDEYYSYNSISGLTSAADGPTEKHDPWVLAGRTILKMQERKDVMRSDRFKQVMLELDPSFDEKEIGFSKFNRFLTEAASRGIISLEKAANGQYEVSTGSRARSMAAGDGGSPAAADDAPAAASRAPEKRSHSRSRGRRSSERKPAGSTTQAPPAEGEAPEVDADRLRKAYELLSGVTAELASPGSPVRDSEVKRRMLERDGKFDEAALGFRKFSRFLRQAHDEGIVDLERGPEGNYLVSPIEGRSAPAAAASEPEPGSGRSRRGRGDRGRRSSRDADATRARETEAAAEEAPQPAAQAPEAPREAGPEPERSERDAGTQEPREATDSAPETAADSRRSVGMGRFRRGSRSRGTAPAGSKADAGPRAVPGPTDAGDTARGPEADRPPSTAADGEQPGKPATEAGGARRSVSGRSRGRGRGTEKSGPAREAASGTKPPASSGSRPGGEFDGTIAGYRSEIEAMSRNYPGVGLRTAEVLFREFGDRVYSVIDNNPDRIRAVLPEHRARAVFAGREAERAKQ